MGTPAKSEKRRMSHVVLETIHNRFPSIPFLGGSRGGSRAASTGSFRRADDDADDWVPEPTRSFLPHHGFTDKNDNWISGQRALISIFQGKRLSLLETSMMYQNIRKIGRSELGPFVSEYYKVRVMPKGLRYLKDEASKHPDGQLQGLASVWNKFYGDILPMIQMILHPVKESEPCIRDVTLLGFRDHVLLQLDMAGLLAVDNVTVPPAVEQALLVVQGVPDGDPPSPAALRLERLVACVVMPYLGYRGLYTGGPDPSIPTLHPPPLPPPADTESYSPSSENPSPQPKRLHIRQSSSASGVIPYPLPTVCEDDLHGSLPRDYLRRRLQIHDQRRSSVI